MIEIEREAAFNIPSSI